MKFFLKDQYMFMKLLPSHTDKLCNLLVLCRGIAGRLYEIPLRFITVVVPVNCSHKNRLKKKKKQTNIMLLIL